MTGAVPPAHTLAELAAVDLGGIGADVSEVGVEHRAAQAALVTQGEAAAVLELHAEAIPARMLGGVDDDRAGHPQVKAKRRAILGIDPEELAAAVDAGEPVSEQTGGDLPRGVGPADVAVAIVDGGDAPAQHRLERLTRALGFGQFGHGTHPRLRAISEPRPFTGPASTAPRPSARAHSSGERPRGPDARTLMAARTASHSEPDGRLARVGATGPPILLGLDDGRPLFALDADAGPEVRIRGGS